MSNKVKDIIFYSISALLIVSVIICAVFEAAKIQVPANTTTIIMIVVAVLAVALCVVGTIFYRNKNKGEK